MAEVGKTALCSRFMKTWRDRVGHEYSPTIGADFSSKFVLIDKKKVAAHVYHFAGQVVFCAFVF